MSNRTTLALLREMNLADTARLPLDQLALLLDDLAALKADAKQLGDLLHDALHARFGDAASTARRAEGKDTGRVRLEQDGFEIAAASHAARTGAGVPAGRNSPCRVPARSPAARVPGRSARRAARRCAAAR